MNSKPPAFSENKALNGAYKASLFKQIFSARKALLTGYPAVNKGLAFPDLKLKFGSNGSYTFKTNDVADKFIASEGGRELQARYKKNTGNWDILWKQKVRDINVFCKYEERGQSRPSYLVGGTWVLSKTATADCKINLCTGVVKKSVLVNMNDYLPGLKLAYDVKTAGLKIAAWNLGAVCAHRFGSTSVALDAGKGSSDLAARINHEHKIDKSTTVLLETDLSITGEKKAPPVAIGIGRKLDADHTLKVRVNRSGHLNAKLEKKFSSNVSLELATCVDLYKTETIMKVPAFGFKLVASV